MGIVFRQSIKAIIITFTGAFLGALYSLLVRKVLPPNQVGISTNLINQGAVLQSLLLVGSVSVVFAYLQRYKDAEEKRSAILTIAFLLPALATTIFYLPYLSLKDQLVNHFQAPDRPYMLQFFLWLPVLSFLFSYMSLLEVFLASRNKAALGAFGKEILLRLCNLILLGFVYYNLISFYQFVLGTILSYGIAVSLLLVSCFRQKTFRFSLRWGVLDRHDIKGVLQYAWYHMLTGVTINLMGYLDSLLLMPLSRGGSKDLAVYGIAQVIVSFLYIPYRAMINAVFNNINEAYVASDQSKLFDLYRRASINMLIASAVMYVVIIPNLQNVAMLFPPEYAKLKPLVLILCVGRLVDIATGLNTEILSITPQYRFNFRISIFLIITVVTLDRLLIPRYSIYGAAWVTSSTLILFNIIKLAYLYKHTGLQPFTIKTLAIIVSIGLISLVGYNVPVQSSPFIDVPIRSLLALLIFGLLIYKINPSTDIKDYLRSIRQTKRIF